MNRIPFRIRLASILAVGVFASISPAPLAQDLTENDEASLRQLLADRGNDPYIRHGLGTLLFRKGQLDRAKEQWNKASEDDPNLPPADLSLASELMLQGRIPAAARALQAAKDEFEDSAHFELVQGQLALRRGDLAGAERLFHAAHTRNPDLPLASVWLGKHAEIQRDYAKAQAYFQRITELLPKRPLGWQLIAHLHFRRGKIRDSLAVLRRAESLGIESRVAEAQLAAMYLQTNDRISARHWLMKSIQRQPENDRLKVQLGRTLIQLKQGDEARFHLLNVVEHSEDGAALAMLADLDVADGQDSRAELYLRRLLKVAPSHPAANASLAMLLLRTGGDLKDATECAERSMRATPNDARSRLAYGCVLAESGETGRSLKLLTDGVRRAPESPWARYYLGKLLAPVEPETARVHLGGVLILDKDFPRKEEVETLIGQLRSR